MQAARLDLIGELGVSLVLDVGANAGQYASRLRTDGYTGEIISFEPLHDAFARLEDTASDDPRWQARRLGLTERNGRAELNVSANSYSSSLLPISEMCIEAAPDAAFIRTEEVEMATLDSLDLPDRPTLLKIDVQGYEPQVIRGARRLLSRVVLLELELSLVSLYEGQELAPEVCELVRETGFVPVALDVAFSHPVTREILQLDVLFRRVSVPPVRHHDG
jgi:FkbM family methyltransferase